MTVDQQYRRVLQQSPQHRFNESVSEFGERGLANAVKAPVAASAAPAPQPSLAKQGPGSAVREGRPESGPASPFQQNYGQPDTELQPQLQELQSHNNKWLSAEEAAQLHAELAVLRADKAWLQDQLNASQAIVKMLAAKGRDIAN